MRMLSVFIIKFASSKVLVEITANEVIPFDENQREITRHKRLYGGHKQQSMNWLPYLTQLSRYPRALKYTGIYQMLPPSMQKYLESCSNADCGKILKAIATLTEKSGFDNAAMTVERALLHDARDVDSLINLHRLIHDNLEGMVEKYLT